MQAKTTKLEAISSKLGRKNKTDKTKTIKINSNAKEQTMIHNLGIEDITGGTDEDVLARMGKARSAFTIP